MNHYYEKERIKHQVRHLQRKANSIGYNLVPAA